MIPALVPMPYAPLSDEEVVRRVLGGEKPLFELLMRRYNQRLFRTGMAFLPDVDAVEEAMQNAWVKAYEHLAQFEGRAGLATWLTRILLNECQMGQRRQRRYTGLDHMAEHPELSNAGVQTPLQAVLNEELRVALEKAVNKLPDRYRSVFMLRAVEGMSVTETAQYLSLTETNVKVRLLRAREQLRQQLSAFEPRHAFTYLGPLCNRMVRQVLMRLEPLPSPSDAPEE